MIPVLFPSDATAFTTQGLGALTDAISCTVTEERNGIYELEMQYPANGIHADDISTRAIITAIPSPYRDPQPFRIYQIDTPIDGVVTIYAQHISYDLSGIPVNPFSANSTALALDGLKTNAAVNNPFSFATDVQGTSTFSVSVPTAARSCLGGVEGSILDQYGGEYEFDGFTVYLHSQRGKDSGVSIRYGKNLTDLSQTVSSESTVTGVLPYWYDEQSGALVSGGVVSAGTYDYTRVIPLDMSRDFEAQPSAADLQSAAQSYIERNGLDTISLSLDVSFVQLEQMSGYEDLRLLEQCDLCDTVTVQYEPLGVDVTAKIVSVETDVLLERYNKVTVGSIAANIAQTISNQQQEIEQAPTTSAMLQAIGNATNLITGNVGGYVVLHKNAAGQPYEILIMDTQDITTAQKVWRWNSAGLGYSSTGYNGPYGTAITMDGSIVADYITTGTLTANLIKTGTMLADRIMGGTLTLGGQTGGKITIYDENQELSCNIDVAGIDLYNSESSGGYWIRLHAAETDLEINGYSMRIRPNGSLVGGASVTPNNIYLSQQSGGSSSAYSVAGISKGNLLTNPSIWYGMATFGYTGAGNTTTIRLDGYQGSGSFSGGVTQGSDRRLKANIRDLPEELVDALLSLNPKTYTLKASGKKAFGFVAQDVQRTPLADALVQETESGMLHLDYTSLHALEVAAIQRMRGEIDVLKSEIKAMKGEKT